MTQVLEIHYRLVHERTFEVLTPSNRVVADPELTVAEFVESVVLQRHPRVSGKHLATVLASKLPENIPPSTRLRDLNAGSQDRLLIILSLIPTREDTPSKDGSARTKLLKTFPFKESDTSNSTGQWENIGNECVHTGRPKRLSPDLGAFYEFSRYPLSSAILSEPINNFLKALNWSEPTIPTGDLHRIIAENFGVFSYLESVDESESAWNDAFLKFMEVVLPGLSKIEFRYMVRNLVLEI